MSIIDTELAKLAPEDRRVLEHVRDVIVATMPDAQECITYAMPGYKYKKKYLVAFAAFKNHMSIFPGAAAIEACADMLEGYVLSKGTVQFTVEKPLSDEVIRLLVRARAAEIDA